MRCSRCFIFLRRAASAVLPSAAINDQINQPDASYELSVADSLWAQKSYPFLPEYVNVLARSYAVEAHNVDFVQETEGTRQSINAWVEDRTHDRIKGLFPAGSIDSLTRLVLVNAIYFKGSWTNKFDEAGTRDEDFHVSPGQTVNVPMMRHLNEVKFNYKEADGVQVLEMPYEGDRLSMFVLLPKDGDLQGLESSLSLEKINELRGGLQEQQVDVYMPKFTLNTKYFMNQTLAAMGMPSAFSPGAADFSGMDGTRNLFIATVCHQAFVRVDEEGTEAAAATGVGMEASASVVKPVFRADHPFIFIIQDRSSGNILFLGRLSNPGAEQS